MKLTKTSFDTKDKISEAISLIFLLASILIVAFTIPNLPDTIPAHYSITGKVDRYESKHMLWIIVAFSIAVYVGLTLLSVFPRLYKKQLSGSVTEEQYRLTAKTTRTMKAVIILSLLIISYVMTHSSQLSNESIYMIPFFILLIVVMRLGKP